MAPDGRCKFGDAKGDGYVRSEGAGVVLLKPLDGRAGRRRSRPRGDPRQRGEQRRAGAAATWPRPAGSGQAAMLRRAYADAAASTPPGSATSRPTAPAPRAGDPVELGALGDVLGAGRRGPGDRCLRRIGEDEHRPHRGRGRRGRADQVRARAASTARCPPASTSHEPNPAIPWDELPFDVPHLHGRGPVQRHGRGWPASARFGITGTNAHVVLEEAPARATPIAPADDRPLLRSCSPRPRPTALRGARRRVPRTSWRGADRDRGA